MTDDDSESDEECHHLLSRSLSSLYSSPPPPTPSLGQSLSLSLSWVNNLTPLQASNQVSYISLEVLHLPQSTQEVDILLSGGKIHSLVSALSIPLFSGCHSSSSLESQSQKYRALAVARWVGSQVDIIVHFYYTNLILDISTAKLAVNTQLLQNFYILAFILPLLLPDSTICRIWSPRREPSFVNISTHF